jgi:hypothetical protein
MAPRTRTPLAPWALLPALLAACASGGAPVATIPPAPTDPAALAAEEKEGFRAPSGLEVGDRWFVAVRPGDALPGKPPVPFAVRNRRVRDDGFVREEVLWGRSFAEAAAARHGTLQVTGLVLDPKGLAVAPVGPDGRLADAPRLELALPFRPGSTWEVPVSPRSPPVLGAVERVEEVDTPGGKMRALRVSHRILAGDLRTATVWYDRGLRPVRMEFRESGALLEAQAALAGTDPTPEQCRAALEWAARHLAR